MDLFDTILNFVVPPASMVMLAFAWPALSFIHALEWLFKSMYREDMENKVVLITGASSAIGEQLAYEYAKRKANLVLIAREENRLWGIREDARIMGAKQVLVMAADVVKEDDCRRFITETISYFGHLHHLVNAASLGHNFYFEEATDTSVFPHMMDINFWGNVYPTHAALPYLKQNRGRILVNASLESWLPMPRMSLYAAAKAAVMNFYDTLRFEVKDGDVGIIIATYDWLGSEMSRGRYMLEEGGAGEKELQITSGHAEEFASMMVAGACRGDAYVKHPRWYDIFLLYRVLAPDVLGWTFRLLLLNDAAKTPGRPIVGAAKTTTTTTTTSRPFSRRRRLLRCVFLRRRLLGRLSGTRNLYHRGKGDPNRAMGATS